MKDKAYLMTDLNLSQEHVDFLKIVKSEIEQFLKSDKSSNFVLLFPPLNSYRRFLIHNLVQESFAAQNLTTFSVGQDSARRTTICHSAQLLPSSQSSDECERSGNKTFKMLENEVMVSSRIKSKSKATRSLNIYQPPAVRAAEQRTCKAQSTYEIKSNIPVNSKANRRCRRPDQQRYVPRPLRSEPPEEKTVKDDKMKALSNEDMCGSSVARTPTIDSNNDNILNSLNEGNQQGTQTSHLPKSCDASSNEVLSKSDGTSEMKRISLEDVKTKNHFLEYLDCVVESTSKTCKSTNSVISPVKLDSSVSSIEKLDSSVSPLEKHDGSISLIKPEKFNNELMSKCISPATIEEISCTSDSISSITFCKGEKLEDPSLDLVFEESSCCIDCKSHPDSCSCRVSILKEINNAPYSENVAETENKLDRVRENVKDICQNSEDIFSTEPVDFKNEKNNSESELEERIKIEETLISSSPSTLLLALSSKTEILLPCDKNNLDKIEPCSKRKEVEDDELHSVTKSKHMHLNDVPHVLVISEPVTPVSSPLALNPLEKPINESNSEKEVENNDKAPCIQILSNEDSPYNTLNNKKSEISLPSAENCDSWEVLFDDERESLEPAIVDELSKSVGEVKIVTATNDYSAFQTIEERTSNGECIIEIYGFPAEFTTRDLLSAFAAFRNKAGFHIKWVDDTHALAVFNSPLAADEVLSCELPFVKTRPLRLGVPESRVKARSIMLPSAIRPKTCTALARRLVTGALGIRVRADKKEREAEKLILKEARDKRRLAAQQKEAAWDGTITSNR